MIRDFHQAIMDGGGYGHWFLDGAIGIAGIATLCLVVLFAGTAFVRPAIDAERAALIEGARL